MRIGNLSGSLLVIISALIFAFGCTKTSTPSASPVATSTQTPSVQTANTPAPSHDQPTSPTPRSVKKMTKPSKDAQIAALQKAVAERDAQIAALKPHTNIASSRQIIDVPNETPSPDATQDIQPQDSGQSLKVKMQSFISHYVFSHPSKAITVENANVRDVRVIDVKQNSSAAYPYAVYTYVFLNYTPGTDEYNQAPMGSREQYLYLCNPDTGDVASVKTF